jgi:hypothetical protein
MGLYFNVWLSLGVIVSAIMVVAAVQGALQFA